MRIHKENDNNLYRAFFGEKKQNSLTKERDNGFAFAE